MEEPALTEAVQTDLPSPKPRWRKRLVLRFAVLVAAVSVLGAAYWFTRPPELVWWRSPYVGTSTRYVRTLIPTGWEVNGVKSDPSRRKSGGQSSYYTMVPVDNRPGVLRTLFPSIRNTDSFLFVMIDQDPEPRAMIRDTLLSEPSSHLYAVREVAHRTAGIYAEVRYKCDNDIAFHRTYRQICNSLRIE
jgi:hypothetical protein